MPYSFSNGAVSTSCMSLPSGPNTETVPSFLAASSVVCQSAGAAAEPAGLAAALAGAAAAALAAVEGFAAAAVEAAGEAAAGELAGAAAPPQADSRRARPSTMLPRPPQRERVGERDLRASVTLSLALSQRERESFHALMSSSSFVHDAST